MGRIRAFGISVFVLCTMLPPLVAGCGRESAASGSGSSLSSNVRSDRASAMRWPEARVYGRMTYASDLERVLLVGGEANSVVGLTSGLPGNGGVWGFDARARRWNVVAPSNPFVSDCAAYDARAHRLIAWSSFTATGNSLSDVTVVADTWALDPESGAWENRHPASSPPAGNLCGGAQMAYDSQSGKVIMFGGLDLGLFIEYVQTGDESLIPLILKNDTWAYDYEANTWTKTSPPVSPPPRNSHGLAYDADADRVILFGGGDFFTDFDDTWAYDYEGNTWTEMKPPVHPSARSYTSLAYDREAKVTVLFGGVDYFEDLIGADQTWTYSSEKNGWLQRYPATHPSARGWHDMAYSERANAVVLFGGGVDRNQPTDETWIYRTASDTWAQVPSHWDVCYAVQDLGPVYFEDLGLQALGINPQGTVVGTTLRWSPGVRRGFIYEKESLSQLGTLGGGLSDVRAVNGRGLAVGGSTTPAGAYRAASFYKGTVTDLGTLDGTNSWAVDVNAAGLAVGNAVVAGTYHAAAFHGGQVVDLGMLGGDTFANGVNDRGDIVGSGQTADGTWKGFLLRDGEMLPLGTIDGAGSASSAEKINNSGTVCGHADAPGGYHGFLYRDGEMTDLGDFGPFLPGFGFSACQDISDSGEAVGVAADGNGAFHAFLWRNSREGLIDINTRIPNDADRVYLFFGSGINAAGQITSYGCNLPECSEAAGYLLSPVKCPEQ